MYSYDSNKTRPILDSEKNNRNETAKTNRNNSQEDVNDNIDEKNNFSLHFTAESFQIVRLMQECDAIFVLVQSLFREMQFFDSMSKYIDNYRHLKPEYSQSLTTNKNDTDIHDLCCNLDDIHCAIISASREILLRTINLIVRIAPITNNYLEKSNTTLSEKVPSDVSEIVPLDVSEIVPLDVSEKVPSDARKIRLQRRANLRQCKSLKILFELSKVSVEFTGKSTCIKKKQFISYIRDKIRTAALELEKHTTIKK